MSASPSRWPRGRAAHLATDALARHYPADVPLRQRLFSAASLLLVLLPWSAFILIPAGAASTWQSIRQLEAFPDTANPFYFVIKFAAWLMALLVAAQALRDLRCRAEWNAAGLAMLATVAIALPVATGLPAFIPC